MLDYRGLYWEAKLPTATYLVKLRSNGYVRSSAEHTIDQELGSWTFTNNTLAVVINGQSANFKFDSALQYWKGTQPNTFIAKKRGIVLLLNK